MRAVTRLVTSIATVTLLTAAPLWAQTGRGYVTGLGGFATGPETTSGHLALEGGVRFAPRLSVFGNLGQFHDLQPSDEQPAVESTTALTTAQGLDLLGISRVPAWYSTGGLRYEVPTHSRISPYVLGGIGAARLTPKARFIFEGGTLADGSTPRLGEDVTRVLVSDGEFTVPTAANAFMFTVGGGVDLPVARHWAVDTGYRVSRVSDARR